MANGLENYNVEDVSDEAQVADSDLTLNPEALYFLLGRVIPQLAAERVSLRDLINHLDAELASSQTLVTEANARLALQGAFEAFRNDADPRIEENTHGLGLLGARVAALERGAGSRPATPGTLTFGLRAADGTAYDSAYVAQHNSDNPLPAPQWVVVPDQTADYPDLPTTLGMRFPQTQQENDVFFFTYPAGVQVQHIWSTALGRHDETARWVHTSRERKYTSPPQPAGAAGSFQVTLAVTGG